MSLTIGHIHLAPYFIYSNGGRVYKLADLAEESDGGTVRVVSNYNVPSGIRNPDIVVRGDGDADRFGQRSWTAKPNETQSFGDDVKDEDSANNRIANIGASPAVCSDSVRFEQGNGTATLPLRAQQQFLPASGRLEVLGPIPEAYEFDPRFVGRQWPSIFSLNFCRSAGNSQKNQSEDRYFG